MQLNNYRLSTTTTFKTLIENVDFGQKKSVNKLFFSHVSADSLVCNQNICDLQNGF